MAEEHRYYSVFDLLELKGKAGIQAKLDGQIRSNPSLSGVMGATNARLKPGNSWRVTAVQSWLPDPIEAPLRVNEDLMKTAQPRFTPYGLMYKPYADDVAVFTLDNSPAPMAAEMEIALEAVIEAYDKSAANEDGKVPIHTKTLKYILPAHLDMDKVSLELGSLEPERPFSTGSGRIYLNEYLLPASWDAVADDLLARRILLEFMPECLYYPLPVDAYELVRRMGLTLRWKLLSRDFGILGEIFNKGCKTHIIEVHSREEDGNFPVDAGTILIDDRLRSGNHYPMEVIYTTLVHECVHWYKDRLYIALQDVFSPQASLSICRNSPAAHRSGLFEQEESSDLDLKLPSDLMEAQALAVPPHILINAESGRKKVEEIIRGFGGEITADNYFSIIDEMRDFFAVTRYAADKRLREFGYRIPRLDRSSRRFTYKKRADSGIEYEVSFDRMLELYDEEKYPDYCRLLQTGKFIHADFRLCLDSDEYIEYDALGIPHLTAYARSNPSQCCIAFRVTAARDPDLGSGAMAAARPKPEPISAIPEPSPDFQEANSKLNSTVDEAMELAKKGLGEEMDYHRRHPREVTFMAWSVMSFVAESRLKKLCKDPVRPKPEFKTFFRAMLALKLEPKFTLPLIKKAGVEMPDNPEHQMAVLNVLLTYFEHPVLEVHRLLYTRGYQLIETNMLKKNDLDERGELIAK